jgi:Integrase core domain.
MDHFTHWPEAFSLPDITTETVSPALLSGWISCFSQKKTITTDQRHQFESQLFYCLVKLCDIQLCRTSPHFANGHVECLHRSLKAAIMCHEPASSNTGSTPSPTTFIHKDVQDSIHNLLWQDAVHCVLDLPRRGLKSLPALKKRSEVSVWQADHHESRPRQTCIHLEET